MDNCTHAMTFPPEYKDGATLCGAYHSSSRPDGLEWGHFPICNDDNCPLKNPTLLDVSYVKRGVRVTERSIL